MSEHEWFDKFDPIAADFTYVRWLGDRKGIEQQTKVWDKIIADRHAELSEWADILGKVHKRKIQISWTKLINSLSMTLVCGLSIRVSWLYALDFLD